MGLVWQFTPELKLDWWSGSQFRKIGAWTGPNWTMTPLPIWPHTSVVLDFGAMHSTSLYCGLWGGLFGHVRLWCWISVPCVWPPSIVGYKGAYLAMYVCGARFWCHVCNCHKPWLRNFRGTWPWEGHMTKLGLTHRVTWHVTNHVTRHLSLHLTSHVTRNENMTWCMLTSADVIFVTSTIGTRDSTND